MSPVSSRLFWRAAAVQAALVGALFAVLAILLPHSFFKHWGILVGPIAWIVCAAGTGAILRIPLPLAAVSAAAGGVAGAGVRAAPRPPLCPPGGVGGFPPAFAGFSRSA